MGRSIKKGPYIEPSLTRKIEKFKATDSRKPIKTWSRRSTISPDFVGLNFQVHNGKTFDNLFVTENMVGHKLGEFAPTRKFKSHGSHTKKVTK